VSGVLTAIPSHLVGGVLAHIGFFGFFGLGVWTLIVSVMLLNKDPLVSPIRGTSVM